MRSFWGKVWVLYSFSPILLILCLVLLRLLSSASVSPDMFALRSQWKVLWLVPLHCCNGRLHTGPDVWCQWCKELGTCLQDIDCRCAWGRVISNPLLHMLLGTGLYVLGLILPASGRTLLILMERTGLCTGGSGWAPHLMGLGRIPRCRTAQMVCMRVWLDSGDASVGKKGGGKHVRKEAGSTALPILVSI